MQYYAVYIPHVGLPRLLKASTMDQLENEINMIASDSVGVPTIFVFYGERLDIELVKSWRIREARDGNHDEH
jgi:hypothetical protein